MRILLINHYAGSPHHGMEFRPYYLCREWHRRGHQARIVAASFAHVRTVQPQSQERMVREPIDGIEYCWLKTNAYRGNEFGRVRNMLTFVVSLSLRAKFFASNFRPSVVIASSTYPLDIFPARRIACLSQARLIFEVHDLWPLSPQLLGGYSPWHPFIATMRYAERRAYRCADRVVSMVPAAKQYMVTNGLAPENFVYIPNGVAMEEWEQGEVPLPPQHQEALSRLKQTHDFLIGYAGAHGVANALETIVDAARLVPQGVHFVLVGDGPNKEALRERAATVAPDRVSLLPPVPKRSIPALLRSFDALVLAWQRCELYRYGISPNKLLDYMMSSRPVLHAVEAANDPVAEAGCGVSVAPADPLALAQGVAWLRGLGASEREAMGRRGREHVVRHHRYEVLAEKFESIFAG